MDSPKPKKPSVRTQIPRIANGLLWLVFCAVSGTGLLLAFRLLPGSRGGRGLTAMGWGRHDWGDIHTWLSYAFLALILTHMALHWRWFWQVVARRKSWPLLLGIGAGLALMMWLFLQPIEKEAAGEGSQESEPRQSRLRQRGVN